MNKLSNHEIVSEESVWGNVTDPRVHNPQKFRYLVHGINPYAKTTMQMIAATEQRDDPTTINSDDGDQSTNLYTNPEMLAQRVSISSSLIDEKHHGTWGAGGLIIEAPTENVVITSTQDAGSVGMSKKLLEQQARSRRKLTANKLLQETSPGVYNEVVVLANHTGKSPRLVGFFIKTNDKGVPKNEAIFRKMRGHARRLNLPIVSIAEPNPYSENKITRLDHRLSVQYDGLLYTLKGEERWKFTAYEYNQYSVFASPAEIESVFRYLQENRVSNDEIEQLRTEYQLVDSARQRPKVNYGENGNITYIRKRSGYGKHEIETTILSGGYSKRINVIDENIKFSESMADPSSYRMESEHVGLVSPHDAEQIVQEAILNAPIKEKKKIQEWWDLVKGNLSNNWAKNRGYIASLPKYFGS